MHMALLHQYKNTRNFMFKVCQYEVTHLVFSPGFVPFLLHYRCLFFRVDAFGNLSLKISM